MPTPLALYLLVAYHWCLPCRLAALPNKHTARVPAIAPWSAGPSGSGSSGRRRCRRGATFSSGGSSGSDGRSLRLSGPRLCYEAQIDGHFEGGTCRVVLQKGGEQTMPVSSL